MFHPSTERLIGYWRDRQGETGVPDRADVNPGDFTDLLPQVFIIGRERLGRAPFRLVGGFVSDLHGRDLRGEDALGLWSLSHRLELKSSLEVARRRGQPVVVTADIHAQDVPTVGMEVLFAPLRGASGETDRFLGLYQPIALIQRLMGQPAHELSVRRIQPLGVANQEGLPLRLAALHGRQIA